MNNLSNGRRAAEKIKYPEEEVVEQSKGKMTVLPSGRVKKWVGEEVLAIGISKSSSSGRVMENTYNINNLKICLSKQTHMHQCNNGEEDFHRRTNCDFLACGVN
jgi:hypothetical protein